MSELLIQEENRKVCLFLYGSRKYRSNLFFFASINFLKEKMVDKKFHEHNFTTHNARHSSIIVIQTMN